MKEIKEHVAKLAANHKSFIIPVMYSDEQALVEWCDHYGVETVEQYEQAAEWESYYDIYKEVYGIRPRWTKWTDHTSEEWAEMNSSLLAEMNSSLLDTSGH